MSVVVIGAGLSGLAATLHLLGQGEEVVVLERESVPGGRAMGVKQDGFTFDYGPTVFTMVELLDEAFQAVGRRVQEEVPLRQLDPAYRAFYADGSVLDLPAGVDSIREAVREASGDDEAASFDRYVKWLKALYKVEMPYFIDANFDSPLDLAREPRALERIVRLGGFKRLGPTVEQAFKDERWQRLFSFQAMYAGLAPRDALALYCVISYMDSILGVWFPETGGIRAVPEAMARVAEEEGATIHYGAEVERILTGSKGVTGVRLSDGDVVRADRVICTVDLPIAYDELLPELSKPGAVKRANYSPSCTVLHLGVKGEPPKHAAHHNITFGRDWDEAFADIMDRGRPMQDPSRFVVVPSLDDENAAPEECTSLFILEPTPNLEVGSGINWDEEGKRMRDRILEDLDARGYPTDVVTERLVTPKDWRAQGMAAGTPFAVSHAFATTGPFRPKNIDERVPGLIFAGSSTTPGVGIPMVLISGKLAAERATGVHMTGVRRNS